MLHHADSVIEVHQPWLVCQLKDLMKPSTAFHHCLAIQIQRNGSEDVSTTTQVVQPAWKNIF